MGVSTSAHPYYQAFALPRVKDKQRSQPTPSDIIFIGYNTPTQTLIVALSSVTRFKVAKFDSTE